MLDELLGCVQRRRSWAKKRESYLWRVGLLRERGDIRVAWRLKSLFWYVQSGQSRGLRRFGEALDAGPCVAVGKSGRE